MSLEAAPSLVLAVNGEPVARLLVKRALESLGCASVLGLRGDTG